MAKKGKGNKAKSLRGHVEQNVLRFREKKELIRVDRDGNPINKNLPYNVMNKAWLLDEAFRAPPVDHTKTPPPDNVTSITSGNKEKPKVNKPVSKSGNEAEKIQHNTTNGTNTHGWLHDKALAASEFKHWSRVSKELGRNCVELWTKDDKGKLHSDSLDLQRKRSKDGHNRLKFDKPPSTVENPFLKKPEHGGYATDAQARPVTVHNQQNRKLDRKFWDMSAKHVPKAPSGMPISEFVTGRYKPPEKAVVYTTPPPTPTRDWRASNDSHYRAEPIVTTASEWARKTKASVQWFINHVEVQNWPTHIHNFVRWVADGPVPNTGAINKAASHPETELILMRNLNDGLQKDWHMLDQALLDSQSEANLLRQELHATRNEVKLLEFELAHHTGDTESIAEISKELNIVEPKPPQVPDDADTMLRELRMYQAFERVYGPEHAFARFVYKDPTLGQVMREHADRQAAHRLYLFEERQALRRIAANVKQRMDNSGGVKYPEIKRFRECAALYRIKNNVKTGLKADYHRWWEVRSNSSLYYSRLKYQRLEKDVNLFRKWGKKATQFNRKKPVNYQQVINSVVGVRSVEYSAPHLVYHFKELGFTHKKYMNEKVAKYYLSQTWKGSVVKSVNKFVDFLNTEVSPMARKRNKEEAIARRNAKAESRKLREERKAKELARKAFRIAH